MKTIDLDPALNIARDAAMIQAQSRANREGKPMCVYVGPPGSGLDKHSPFNAWFVRPSDEPAPEQAQFHCIVVPETKL